MVVADADGAHAGTLCVDMDVAGRLPATKFTIDNDLDEPERQEGSGGGRPIGQPPRDQAALFKA